MTVITHYIQAIESDRTCRQREMNPATSRAQTTAQRSTTVTVNATVCLSIHWLTVHYGRIQNKRAQNSEADHAAA